MCWNLKFISRNDFTEHVRETILKYGEKLEPYDLKRFNSNIIDPIKMVFDKIVYKYSWEEIIGNEIFRQRDKSSNNDIGYFHQNFFKYIDGCEVPKSGWDVIYKNPAGIQMPEGDIVHTVYVEMKNKHNTMNSASSAKTYIKMQNQLLEDDDCACFLVEAVARKSQNVKWAASVDGKAVSHKRIRRVSMDKFYAVVTGIDDAFYQMCSVLPNVIQKLVDSESKMSVRPDTVMSELTMLAKAYDAESRDLAMAMAVYMLGFNTYNGFDTALGKETLSEDYTIDRVSEYARKLLKIL